MNSVIIYVERKNRYLLFFKKNRRLVLVSTILHYVVIDFTTPAAKS